MNQIEVKVLSFKVPIETKILKTDHIIFQGSAEVSEVRVKDLKDGQNKYTYIVLPLNVEVRKSDNELSKPVKINTDPFTNQKSLSQRLRQKAFMVAGEIGTDPEVLYRQAIDQANDYLDRLADEAKEC